MTDIKSIIVLSASKMKAFDSDQRYAVVSLCDPFDVRPVPKRWGLCAMTQHCFHDLDGAVSEGYRTMAMQLNDADEIAQFVGKVTTDTLVIHCFAGVSRSISVAMAITDHFNLGRDCIDWRQREFHHSVHEDPPNKWCYRLTREALERAARLAGMLEKEQP